METANRGWVVLAALSVMMCIAMSLPLFGGSVVNTYMAVALNWDRQSLGLLVSVNLLMNALLSPVAAGAVRRLGIRKSSALGCAFMIAGGIALATVVTKPWHAVVAFSVMFGFTGALSGVIPCQTGVAGWFVSGRTLALSILYAAMGLGGFAMVWLINAVIAASGDWRYGWWVFAIAGAIGMLVSLLVIRDAPTTNVGPEAGAPAHPQASIPNDMSLGDAARTALLWVTYWSMLAVNAGSAFIVSHYQIYLRGSGFSATAAASTVSLISAAMVGGNLGLSLAARGMDLRRANALGIMIFALSFLLLINVQGTAALLAVALVTGVGFGAAQVGAMAVLGHYWSTRAFPALTAGGLIVQTIAGGLVPVLAGAYFDAHRSYVPVIYAIVAVNVAAALAFTITRAPSAAGSVSSPLLGRTERRDVGNV